MQKLNHPHPPIKVGQVPSEQEDLTSDIPKILIIITYRKLWYMFLVQHECIPQAILGMDIVCQAKSGMGKTAVFVLGKFMYFTYNY